VCRHTDKNNQDQTGAGCAVPQGQHEKEKEMSMTEDQGRLIELAAEIVSAYVSNNTIQASDVPALVGNVYAALTNVGGAPMPVASEPLKPAVNPKKSITPEYIICLEDGKKFKSLKRHLRTMYNLSPEQYREKWGLPSDYPMVAPSYAEARSRLAKEMGLGQARKRTGRR
jgi:predicted transcriptional regulator